jgi:hypothetical protein
MTVMTDFLIGQAESTPFVCIIVGPMLTASIIRKNVQRSVGSNFRLHGINYHR